ncbi:hypothetical protein K7X08_025843 [Anisodus acutangulus]|uniref:Uncharacterized protein n=1 Tax=Anisodus acutangulus TaxID=402998 RepID=A0A9Q1LAP7_9SOLA|nr:hypothetical protein K7X08_025843 [Anisodus acutangulus]
MAWTRISPRYRHHENEEGKGSAEEKEEISIKASDVTSEAKTEVEVEKVVDDDMKTYSTTCVDDIEEVKSKTSIEKNAEEALTPLEESESKIDDQDKLPTAIEEAPEEKTVEEVKLAEKPTIEDKKIEEKPTVVEDPNSEALEKKKTEEKPTATKKSMFWWDK